jgi:hypothetical protein
MPNATPDAVSVRHQQAQIDKLMGALKDVLDDGYAEAVRNGLREVK